MCPQPPLTGSEKAQLVALMERIGGHEWISRDGKVHRMYFEANHLRGWPWHKPISGYFDFDTRKWVSKFHGMTDREFHAIVTAAIRRGAFRPIPPEVTYDIHGSPIGEGDECLIVGSEIYSGVRTGTEYLPLDPEYTEKARGRLVVAAWRFGRGDCEARQKHFGDFDLPTHWVVFPAAQRDIEIGSKNWDLLYRHVIVNSSSLLLVGGRSSFPLPPASVEPCAPRVPGHELDQTI